MIHLIECPVGLYGEMCKEECSPNCKEPGVCDMSTGHCAGGCQAGWTQFKCDSSMSVKKTPLVILILTMIINMITFRCELHVFANSISIS